MANTRIAGRTGALPFLCADSPILLSVALNCCMASADSSLAKTVRADIRTVSPETEVRQHEMEFSDPWDFEEVYETLFKFSRQYSFDTESKNI